MNAVNATNVRIARLKGVPKLDALVRRIPSTWGVEPYTVEIYV